MKTPGIFLFLTAAAFTAAANPISDTCIEPYSCSSGWAIGTNPSPFGTTALVTAMGFTSLSNMLFAGAMFPVRYLDGANDLTVSLDEDNSGTPGTTLESFTLLNRMSSDYDPGLLSITSTLTPMLTAGTPYWLVLSGAGTSALWLDNAVLTRGPAAVNQSGQGFMPVSALGGGLPVQSAFEILGAGHALVFSDLAFAPEPSTLLLAGAVLIGILGLRKVTARRPHQVQ